MTPINASPAELMQQASTTAHRYMVQGEQNIDAQFGEGFARQHPELLGAFMKTCAKDFETSIMAAVVQDMTEAISAEIALLANSLPAN